MPTLREQIKPNILAALDTQPMSIRDMSNHLAVGYYTVREAMRDLQDDARIRAVGYNTRNAKYTISDSGGPNLIIPTIHQDGKRFKLIDLLSLHKAPTTNAGTAVENIPMWIVRILKNAQRLAEGQAVTNITQSNNYIKTGIQQDINHLQKAISVLEQLLANPRNWNVDELSLFVNDMHWDDELVNEAYRHYFPDM